MGPGASPPVVGTLRVVKAFTGLGAQRPGGVPAGGLHFSCEKWRKEHQRGEFLPSGLPTLVWDILRGIPLFCGLACALHPTLASAAPRLGGLGGVGWGTASIEAEGNFRLYKGGTTPKIQRKIFFQKKVPKSGPVHGARKRPSIALLRLYPQRWSEPQRAVLFQGVQGGTPCDSFPLLSYKESRAPRRVGGPPRGAAPRGRFRGTVP